MFLPTTTDVPTETHNITLSGQAIVALEAIHERHIEVATELNKARRRVFLDKSSPLSITVSSLEHTPWLPPATIERTEWRNAYNWQSACDSILFEDASLHDVASDVKPTTSPRQFIFYTENILKNGTELRLPFEETSVLIETRRPAHIDQYEYAELEIRRGYDEPAKSVLTLTRIKPIQRTYKRASEAFSGEVRVDTIQKTPEKHRMKAIDAMIESAGLGNDKRIAIAQFITQKQDTVCLSTNTNPRLVHAIAEEIAPYVQHVPQRGDILLSRRQLPATFEELCEVFPRKQHLTTDEETSFYTALYGDTVGSHIAQATDPYLRGRILTAMLYEDGALSDTDVENYALCPWQPWNREAVHKAVEKGGRVRQALREAEENYHFPASVFEWLEKDGIPVHWSLS